MLKKSTCPSWITEACFFCDGKDEKCTCAENTGKCEDCIYYGQCVFAEVSSND